MSNLTENKPKFLTRAEFALEKIEQFNILESSPLDSMVFINDLKMRLADKNNWYGAENN